jgi:hypothetical protein
MPATEPLKAFPKTEANQDTDKGNPTRDMGQFSSLILMLLFFKKKCRSAAYFFESAGELCIFIGNRENRSYRKNNTHTDTHNALQPTRDYLDALRVSAKAKLLNKAF